MIQAQIMAQEVQLQVMGSYLSASNPEVARVQSSINELRKQLQIMESGKEGKDRMPGDRCVRRSPVCRRSPWSMGGWRGI